MPGLETKHHRERSGLFRTLPTGSHLAALVQKSTRGTTDNPKTNIVVAVVGIVVVAIGRPAVPRIVVPRTAAFADQSRL